ncbi:DUF2487 family protein [Paenibacillus sp. FSL R7-0273]|uniref:DUF2487 family protein n=1 Tax=Paenibacillus sp. FSL R7-0273 TaxID=1536772 RepID=UPI0015C3119A|nr:DUF2487 family protein [Paenibacillus sp. FSL R7-0273]
MEEWNKNGHYYDTCLIPYTGLQGTESPPQAAAVLERLRDLLEQIEQLFRGRIVIYPALQYETGWNSELINDICRKVKYSNFQYVIVVSAAPEASGSGIYESDLFLAVPEICADSSAALRSGIKEKIQAVWQSEK